MNYGQFNTWLEAHCDLFPSLRRKYFLNFDEKKEDAWAPRRKAFKLIVKPLGNDAAVEASRRMASDEKLVPRSFEDHARRVYKLAEGPEVRMSLEAKRRVEEARHKCEEIRTLFPLDTRVRVNWYSEPGKVVAYDAWNAKVEFDRPTKRPVTLFEKKYHEQLAAKGHPLPDHYVTTATVGIDALEKIE